MKSRSFYIFLLAALLSCYIKTYASHIAGGELIYSWVRDSTYHLTFKLYRDCHSTVLEPPSVQICYKSSCVSNPNNPNNYINAPKSTTINGGAPNGTPVNAGCPGYPSTCSIPAGTLPGYQEFWYEGDITLPYRCAKWTFSVNESARNNNDNLLNASTATFYVEATLNNVLAQGNSSAQFTVKPVPYVCDNQPYAYNNGAYDLNNDSLGYQIIQPEAETTCNAVPTDISFIPNMGFNLTNNPIATSNTFVLDTITGQLNFTPSLVGSYTLALRVTEYRNRIAIGTTMRDIQVQVIACGISSPTVTTDTSTIQLVDGKIHDCGGHPLHFCFNANSGDSTAVLVPSDNHLIVASGSAISYTGAFTNALYGCFTWAPTPSDTGIKILTITITDSSCKPPGITESNTFTLPLYIFPSPHTYNNDTFCIGNKMTLYANGVSAYAWSVLPGGSLLSSLSCNTCQSPVDSPTVATTYVASSLSANGCPSYDTASVIIAVAPPVPKASPTSVLLCRGDTLKLFDAVTVPSYLWTGPNGFVSNVKNTILPNFQQADTGTYYIVSKNPYCTSAPDSVQVAIYPPTYALNNDTTICEGSSVVLYGIGDTYIWSALQGGSPVSTLTCTVCLISIATPTVNTSYLISSIQSGCNSTDTVVVHVNNYPSIPILSANAPLCNNDSLKLLAGTTALSYSWTGPNGYTSTQQNPVIVSAQAVNTGKYNLVASNGPCIASTTSLSVLVVQTPDKPVVVTNSPLCAGTILSIVPQSNQTLNYNWTGPNGFTASSPSIVINNVTTQYSGTYTVNTTLSADVICVSPTDTFTVVIKPQVFASFQFLKDSVCQEYADAITYSTPGADSLIWSLASGTSPNLSANPLEATFSTVGLQTVTLRAYNDLCGDTIAHDVYVLPTPPSSFTATPLTCPGIPVLVTSDHNFGQDITYNWDFGAATVASGSNSGLYNLYYSTPGMYVISLTTQNTNCTSYTSYDTVIAQPYPNTAFTSSDISNICSNDSVHFEATEVPGYRYQWLPTVYFANDTLYSTYVAIGNAGYIYLNVTDQYGCKASDSLYLDPHACCNVYFANAFTPNGDGKNDIFKPITAGHHDVAYFRVFDRWGQLVFSSLSESDGWNGVVDGKPADIGTYFYTIKYKCVTGQYFEEKGEVTLLR